MRNLSTSTSLTINGISITGANAPDFAQTNNCGTALAGGATCTISVTFKPTASGPRKGALTISDLDPTSPQQVSLAGTGK